MTTIAPEYTQTGMAVLIAYGSMKTGAALLPPKEGYPGIRVTVEVDGSCILEAVGYPDQPAAQHAIAAATQVCIDAGLRVDTITPPGAYPARRVQRRD